MKLKLLSFGIAKDITGSRSGMIEVDGVCTVGQLKRKLVNLYPAFERLLSIRLAVNEVWQNDDYVLSDGDEVAIIPPVSGG